MEGQWLTAFPVARGTGPVPLQIGLTLWVKANGEVNVTSTAEFRLNLKTMNLATENAKNSKILVPSRLKGKGIIAEKLHVHLLWLNGLPLG